MSFQRAFIKPLPHLFQCRFGPSCQRYPDCPFEHPIPPTQHRNKQLVLNKPHVSERGFSVADDEVVERIPVGESANTTA